MALECHEDARDREEAVGTEVADGLDAELREPCVVLLREAGEGRGRGRGAARISRSDLSS
ncbi:hypothetical protein ADJ73_08915 [Arsenicicoccus sp. oral taxon 190]|nr:hypothetical protein ADJ73_08915 [Arsenicicoccus sp. oral taxon 190]